MADSRKLTLRFKLIVSLGGVGLLVAALLLLGNQIIRDAAGRLEATRTEQVRPLAQVSRLQAQISRIRLLEVELPRLTDLFAVTDQIALLGVERSAFDHALAQFVHELEAQGSADAVGLQEHWRRYQSDLEETSRRAGRMDLEGAQRISTFESANRFKTILRTLDQFARGTEARSTDAFLQALAQQSRQRWTFMATSAVGLTVFAIWIFVLAQSVAARISRLRDAATQLADGRTERPISVSGNDELAELSAAFNRMYENVVAREDALRTAQGELESRVESRTRELNEANALLRHEIDERRHAERQLTRQAQYDSLTNLPNRVLAMDRLAQALLAAQRNASHVVLIFVDLDDFKKVNDTLGHAAGDSLLVQAAQRLRGAVRAEDTVARQGGDEFLIILGGLTSPENAKTIAQKIVDAFVPSFGIGDSEIVVTPSMGMAVYPDDGDDAGTLLRNADMAMYVAKEEGRNTFRYFNKQVHDRSVQRLNVERQLRGAMQRDEFELVYQPLISTTGRRLVGAEALLRWNCLGGGQVAPEQFVPVAEHTGLIAEIGDWVLRTACAQLRRWRDAGRDDFVMSINVSPRQFRGDGLLASVRDCLAVHAIPPGCLQFEVTEGLLIRNQPEVRETLRALTRLGVRLAMDDFGTGYSSLSYLKHFSFDCIKIDREFVRDLATDADDRALVAAAVRMGKALGLSVVAEGVEAHEQLAFLTEQGCDVVQGYLLGRPVRPDQFAAHWLAADPANLHASSREDAPSSLAVPG